MIVGRKPFSAHSIDLAGLAALIALGSAAYYLGIGPSRAARAAHTAMLAEIGMSEGRLHEMRAELGEVVGDVDRFAAKLASLAGEAPDAGALPSHLGHLSDLAERFDLRLDKVTPRPTESAGQHLRSDIEMVARGRSVDFIHFVNALVRENPYQSVPALSIKQVGGSDDELCTLSWTVRLYMFPGGWIADRGGSR